MFFDGKMKCRSNSLMAVLSHGVLQHFYFTGKSAS
jgi:hypothetical protein